LADHILLMMGPDLPSVRAAAAALHTYNKLGYDREKIIIILNSTFEHNGLARKNIETALHTPINLVLPFDSGSFITAMNMGRAFVTTNPERPVSVSIEDLAYRLSKEKHKTASPASPSASLQRVKKRLLDSKDRK
jgi:pilus assembly protein CpaE